ERETAESVEAVGRNGCAEEVGAPEAARAVQQRQLAERLADETRPYLAAPPEGHHPGGTHVQRVDAAARGTVSRSGGLSCRPSHDVQLDVRGGRRSRRV